MSSSRGPWAVLFSGQGSQCPGMGSELAGQFSLFARTFEEASDALRTDLLRLAREGDEPALAQTEVTQPLMLTFGVALARVLHEHVGLHIERTGGHSLGEITALCAADGIALRDAVTLVRARATLMQEAVPVGKGAMAALLGSAQDAEALCAAVAADTGRVLVCANYNAPDQTVISGETVAVESACMRAKEFGLHRAIPLKVSAPFHSPLLQPAAEGFRRVLVQTALHLPVAALYSNVTGARHTGSADDLRTRLAEQVAEPVRFTQQLGTMQADGMAAVLEISPKPTLAAFVRKTLGEAFVVSSVGTVADVRKLEKSGGVHGAH